MKLKQISKYVKIREVSVQNPNSKYDIKNYIKV